MQVGHIERFNPAFEDLIRRPIRPKFVEAERHGPYTGRSVDIGAVLDLMIHDLDLILTLAGGPVREVKAFGVAVLGGHEDMVNARLEFENGCVAHVTASRIAARPKRRMRIWAPEGYAGIDFVSRKMYLVQVSDEVRRHGLRVDRLDAAAKARLKDEVFGRHLEVLQADNDRKCDQLTSELRSFIDCVRHNKPPRVPGEAGRDALRWPSECWRRYGRTSGRGRRTAPSGRTGCPSQSASSSRAARTRAKRPESSSRARRTAGFIPAVFVCGLSPGRVA